MFVDHCLTCEISREIILAVQRPHFYESYSCLLLRHQDSKMEKNGLEGMVPSSVTLWHYLPLEIWYQIFEYLKASRYIGLIGTLSKHFQGVMLDYFTHNVSWMGKNLNIAVIGAPDVGKGDKVTKAMYNIIIDFCEIYENDF